MKTTSVKSHQRKKPYADLMEAVNERLRSEVMSRPKPRYRVKVVTRRIAKREMAGAV